MTKDGLIYTIQLKKKIQKAQELDDVPVWVSYVALKRHSKLTVLPADRSWGRTT